MKGDMIMKKLTGAVLAALVLAVGAPGMASAAPDLQLMPGETEYVLLDDDDDDEEVEETVTTVTETVVVTEEAADDDDDDDDDDDA